MDRSKHTLSCLFSQLGIDNSQTNIDKFINENKGVPAEISLSKATIWNKSQSQFLQDSLQNDSDWADVVDHLNCLLR